MPRVLFHCALELVQSYLSFCRPVQQMGLPGRLEQNPGKTGEIVTTVTTVIKPPMVLKTNQLIDLIPICLKTLIRSTSRHPD